MMRSVRTATPSFLLLCLLASCDGKASKSNPVQLDGAARGWNVLVISVDTIRADRLGAYGYRVHPTSPRMDELLGRGVRFDQAMAQRAATWPSLATFLTGLYPTAHGVTENGYGFPDGLPTLPLVLRGAGYETGAFLSNMCKANHQGWDGFGCTGGEDGKTVQRAIEWTSGRSKAKPYLLWVHLFGAHSPYYNGGDLAAREFDPGYEGPIGPKRWQLDEVHRAKLKLNEKDVRHLDALYDAAVVGSDRQVGALLDGLKAAGKLDKTLIVLLSDHGEELYRHHGYLYHSCSVYQTTLHVPFGIVAEGLLPAGAVVPQVVELADALPTLLDLLGVEKPKEQHGRSLVAYLERPGEGGRGKPAFSEYGLGPVRTVIEGDHKLVWNPTGFSPVCIPNVPPGHYPIARAELYDLRKDPAETTNRADADPARVRALAQRIEQRFAGIRGRAVPQDISPELKKQLEALGYAAQ